MNRFKLTLLSLAVLASLSGPLFAQQEPPSHGDQDNRRDDDRPPPPRRDQDDRRDDDRRPPPPPRMGPMMEMMQRYLDLVDRFTRIARDPVTSGVAAVISSKDILLPKGADIAIDYFIKTLPEVKNEAVQRAIRLQLVELYKTSGQQDKALEQLKILMTAAPAGPTGPVSDGPPSGQPPRP